MFFSIIKTIYRLSKSKHHSSLVCRWYDPAEGEEKYQWLTGEKHFSGLLNRPSTVDPAVLDQIPQKPTINSPDLPPTMEEVEKAINQGSFNKAPGMDRIIPAEIYKAAGPVTLETFQSLLMNIWEEEHMAQWFQRCNSCSTSLRIRVVKLTVAITGASQSHYLLQGRFWHVSFWSCLITSISEENLAEAQWWFPSWPQHPWHGFCSLTAQWEKCIKQNMDLCATFIDLTKHVWHGQQRSTLGYTVNT